MHSFDFDWFVFISQLVLSFTAPPLHYQSGCSIMTAVRTTFLSPSKKEFTSRGTRRYWKQKRAEEGVVMTNDCCKRHFITIILALILICVDCFCRHAWPDHVQPLLTWSELAVRTSHKKSSTRTRHSHNDLQEWFSC
jgi:hypothetical protein